jgi:hypothetical protein
VVTTSAAPGTVFDVRVTAHDGAGGTATCTFAVNVIAAPTQAPTLDALSDLHLAAGASVALTLSATDPDGGAVTFRAEVIGDFDDDSTRLAYELDQQLGLFLSGSYLTNWGGLGEKWLRAADGCWHFLTPDGTLYQWDGSKDLRTSTPVATLTPRYHADPRLLHEAAPPARAPAPATLRLTGDVLTLEVAPWARGAFTVLVRATDEHGACAWLTFSVTVATG